MARALSSRSAARHEINAVTRCDDGNVSKHLGTVAEEGVIASGVRRRTDDATSGCHSGVLHYFGDDRAMIQ
jgi:hypothetical protein